MDAKVLNFLESGKIVVLNFGKVKKRLYICTIFYKIGDFSMNTIALDNKTYNNIEWYARQKNISVTEAAISVLNSFLDKIKPKEHQKDKFYIAPEVKALEVGFQCPNELSDDYKKEMGEILTEKYL